MVAYNFQKKFVDPIRRRDKTHTIRMMGKRRHVYPGEMLQLDCGQRTRNRFKIIDDIQCNAVWPINISVVELEFIESITVSDPGGIIHAIGDMEKFAIADGFESFAAMETFWAATHGEGWFHGRLIDWGDFSPEMFR